MCVCVCVRVFVCVRTCACACMFAFLCNRTQVRFMGKPIWTVFGRSTRASTAIFIARTRSRGVWRRLSFQDICFLITDLQRFRLSSITFQIVFHHIYVHNVRIWADKCSYQNICTHSTRTLTRNMTYIFWGYPYPWMNIDVYTPWQRHARETQSQTFKIFQEVKFALFTCIKCRCIVFWKVVNRWSIRNLEVFILCIWWVNITTSSSRFSYSTEFELLI